MTTFVRAACLCGVVIVAVQSAAPTAFAVDNAECFACHSDQTLVATNAAGKAVSLYVDETKFVASIHAKNLCTSCHSDITEVPHPDNFRAKPVSCAQCHRVETEIYLNSDHGQAIHKGVQEAASCKDCHGNNHYLLNYRNPESPVYRLNLPQTCGRCHGNVAEMEKFNLRQRAVVVTYDKSVHGLAHSNGVANAAVCSDCHGTHDLHRSTNPESKLYWQTIPATCGKCHDNVRQTYSRSIHGKAVASGIRDAPVCTDCHGEHTIQAVKLATSRVSPANIPETCGQCHTAQRIVTQYRLPPNVFTTYIQSFHGLALQGGNLTAANCASCHGVHDILPATDARSTINTNNLPQTCGKCHPGIGTRLSVEFFRIHAPPGAAEGKPWIVNFISRLYIALIAVTIGGMATFNLLDYLRKARTHVCAVSADDHAELRLTRLARIQHFVLMALFIALAYTGFVHKFPDAAWSWPFRTLPNGSYLRGMIHRVCGWTFAAFFATHLVMLVSTPRGRASLQALWFVWADFKDAVAQLAFNIGLRQASPPPRRWNYAEKAEYWALLWGSVVMIVTGAMLVFTDTVLRLWPKVWHDVAQVIHFYEALLATLAIVVWHFYWVIFDPSEYPMNPSWLIGKKAPHEPHVPDPESNDADKKEGPPDAAS